MGKEICQECSKEYEKSDVVGCEFQDMCKTCNEKWAESLAVLDK